MSARTKTADVRLGPGFTKDVARLKKTIETGVQQGLLRAAQAVASEAASHHAYHNRTGALEAATQVGEVSGSLKSGTLTAEVVGDTPYGEYVERKMPFLEPAAETALDGAMSIVEDELQKAIDAAGWKL